jgi:hypothetical protein
MTGIRVFSDSSAVVVIPLPLTPHSDTLISPWFQAEMKSFVRSDAVVLKQHFEKKLIEVEEEKKHVEVFYIANLRASIVHRNRKIERLLRLLFFR